MKKSVLIALAAGSACAVPVIAQTTGVVQMENPDGTFRAQPAVFSSMSTGSSYGGRAVQVALDNYTDLFNSPTLQALGTSHLIEDFTFAPGPWAGAASRVMINMSWSYWIGRWAGAQSPAFTVRFKFLNAAAFDTALNANMIPAGTASIGPDWVIAFAAGAIATPPPVGYVNIFDVLSTPAAGTYNFPNDGFLIEQAVHDPANPSSFAYFSATQVNPYIPPGEAAAGLFGWSNNAKPIGPGNSAVGYGRDLDGDGTFLSGGVLNGGTAPANEWRQFATSTLGPRHVALAIRGDIVTPPPPVDVNLGCITDAGATANVPGRVTGPSSKAVVKFCLTGDATDNARKFLDLIGDQGAGVDFSFGLYNDGGQILAQSDNDGDGGSVGVPMLTFGVGRRAAAYTGGTPRDGRHGELTAGTYYLLVSGPGAGFSDGYLVAVPDPSLDAGSACDVRFQTNTVAGSLAPSDPPNPIDYGGSAVTIPPSFLSPVFQPQVNRVAWFSFDLCEAVGDNTAGEYLDIDLGLSPAGADTQMFLFDGTGNAVAGNDDSNPGSVFTSQISFASPGTPSRAPDDPASVALAGQDGTLAAGTYYMVCGLYQLSTLAAGDRWHVRADNVDSLLIQANFKTDIDCVADGCPCVADFDQSGGTPDAGDIDAFFIAWLLGDPTADADCSGGTPDTSDIDVFFQEWLAGGC